ncbi:hypothetical protein QQF64_022544 [Cirrhinus molitorella]|uniref:Uncharacterized protein n=1 Tax=Cirrhinus molitorella TaxID=172907 RepID=A0ABR3L2T3_9TELE
MVSNISVFIEREKKKTTADNHYTSADALIEEPPRACFSSENDLNVEEPLERQIVSNVRFERSPERRPISSGSATEKKSAVHAAITASLRARYWAQCWISVMCSIASSFHSAPAEPQPRRAKRYQSANSSLFKNHSRLTWY